MEDELKDDANYKENKNVETFFEYFDKENFSNVTLFV